MTAVRQQLPALSPIIITGLEQAPPKPERSLLCPRCGLPMTHRQRIWPRSRWPPTA
ncbi:MAG: hypothetical protein H6660_05785 [Ardenticatenaceae bacterium]|nr:hypothetical protein [Ardenticatenaceae bacterium]